MSDMPCVSTPEWAPFRMAGSLHWMSRADACGAPTPQVMWTSGNYRRALNDPSGSHPTCDADDGMSLPFSVLNVGAKVVDGVVVPGVVVGLLLVVAMFCTAFSTSVSGAFGADVMGALSGAGVMMAPLGVDVGLTGNGISGTVTGCGFTKRDVLDANGVTETFVTSVVGVVLVLGE